MITIEDIYEVFTPTAYLVHSMSAQTVHYKLLLKYFCAFCHSDNGIM